MKKLEVKRYRSEFASEGRAPVYGIVADFNFDLRRKVQLGINLTGINEYEALDKLFKFVEFEFEKAKTKNPVLENKVLIGRSGSHIWIHSIEKKHRIGMLYVTRLSNE